MHSILSFKINNLICFYQDSPVYTKADEPLYRRCALSIKDTLHDEKSAAEFLGLEPGTLAVWRSTRRYNLPFVKIGRLVKYRESDLLAFVESRLQTQ